MKRAVMEIPKLDPFLYRSVEPLDYIAQGLRAELLTRCLTGPYKREHSNLVKHKRVKGPEKSNETFSRWRRFLNQGDML